MIREIRTAEQLVALMEAGRGFLYNDFGGRNPKMCPIHAIGCRWVRTMLSPPAGRLGVAKIWSDDLAELVHEVVARGKVYAFCGSEPGLARDAGGPSTGPVPRPPAASRAVTPRPAIQASAHATESDAFHVRVGDRVVTVASAYRLQFDDKPLTRALKTAIGNAVARLDARDGEILEAVYSADFEDSVDAENVLLYNVGTGRFARAARDGLRFERVFARPRDGSEAHHHHRYALVAADSRSSHWRTTRLVMRCGVPGLPRLDALSKPDSIWLATREAAPAEAREHLGRYALRLLLEVGRGDNVRPADIVKPLVDGVVAGLHAHDGRDSDTLTERLAGRLGVEPGMVRDRLHDTSRAWLGTRRLLWPRADGYQWNPRDEDCVSCQMTVKRGPMADWNLSFEVYDVESLD